MNKFDFYGFRDVCDELGIKYHSTKGVVIAFSEEFYNKA